MVKKISSKNGRIKTIEKNIKKTGSSKAKNKLNVKKFPQLKLKTERSIAMDFAEKVYERFDKLVKSVILFGSASKNTQKAGSDIDVIVIVDDAIVNFDEKLISWYREELGKIIKENPYSKDLHVNTVKLTTWWEDLHRGDPVIINIIRYGEAMIDYAGFFDPFKILLQTGRIKTSPESIYTTLNRVPEHIVRSELAQVGSIDGCYWAMVESGQALLMAVNVLPPSPEHTAGLLKKHFVDKGLMKVKHVDNLRTLYELHRRIIHGETRNLDGKVIDEYQRKANDFFKVVLRLIKELIG